MKYEDIEVGKTYLSGPNERVVQYKEVITNQVAALHKSSGLLVYDEREYKNWTEKHELPDVGLVVYVGNTSYLIYRTGEKSGYGFSRGKYQIDIDWSFGVNPKIWRKATREESELFIELLKKEAQRKGLCEDVKIKECLWHKRKLKTSSDPHFNITIAWNKNGCIFKDGEWAEPLKNDLSEQIEELKNKAKELGLKLNITVE